jgi:hypothetical protein
MHPRSNSKEFCMLSYFDESGIHRDSEACIVAGYFGKKGPWRRLERGWTTVLREFKVPLSEFHAKDILTRNGFFHRWGDKTDALLNSLVNIVSKCPIHPVCYGLFTKDFFSFSLSERRFMTGATWDAQKKKFLVSGCPNKPYFVAFHECVRIVTSYTPAADRAHFSFGSDRPSAEYAAWLFRYLRKRTDALRRMKVWFDPKSSPDKFGAIAFPLAKETPELQLADLFSYMSYRHMLERSRTGDWNTPPGRILLGLLRHRKSPFDTSYRTAKLLRDMISTIPDLPNQ